MGYIQSMDTKDSKKVKYFPVPLEEELRTELDQIADKEGRTTTQQILYMLRQSVKDRQKATKTESNSER